MGFWSNLFKKSAGGIKITNSKDLAKEIWGGGRTNAGEYVNANTAMTCAAAYSCARIIADSIAQLPCILYRRTERGKERANDIPLYSLLHDAPNEFQTAFEYWNQIVWHILFRGNAYSFKNYVGESVVELNPIHPDNVTPKQNSDLSIEYTIHGYPRPLTQKEIIHYRGLTLNGITGMSVIEYAKESIGLAMAAEKHGSTFFGNGATVDGVLSTDASLTKEQTEIYRESWRQVHGGGNNAHKTAVLGGGLKYQPIALSQKDSQFIESRAFQTREIAAMFGVPSYMLNDLEQAQGWSTLEMRNSDFLIRGLMPHIRRFEQTIWRDLLDPAQKKQIFAEFLIEGYLRADSEKRAGYYRIMREIGVYSANEIREMENRNKREDAGGDEYLTPANMNSNQGNANGVQDQAV
jgi:HK97 family phage portal protein